jgi:hemolysin III
MPDTHFPLCAEHRADRAILAIGLVLSMIGFGWLLAMIAAHPGTFRGWSCAIYGCALVLMYSCATVYHWLPDDRPRSIIRILDHSAIFVLIAGTYTPFTLPNVSAFWARGTLLLMWLMVAAGIILKIVSIGKTDRFSILLYLAMGWSAVMVIHPLSESIPVAIFRLIVVGGVLYSIGAIVYTCKRLPYRLPIWHLFVIAGSAVHYVAVASYIGT